MLPMGLYGNTMQANFCLQKKCHPGSLGNDPHRSTSGEDAWDAERSYSR